MARYKKARRRSGPQRDWRFFASIIVGVVIVLAGVGLIIGITVGGASSGNSQGRRCTPGGAACPAGYFCCPSVGRCVPTSGGCPA